MAYPSFVAASAVTSAASASTTAVIDKPAGTAQGDLMIAVLNDKGTAAIAASVTLPSGWTLKYTLAPGGGALAGQRIATKIAGGSEPANYTFTYSASVTKCGYILTYSNAGDVEAALGSVGHSTTAAGPSVTTLGPERIVALAIAGDQGSTPTTPTGYTSRVATSATSMGLRLADAQKALAGATGLPPTSTVQNEDWATIHFAISRANVVLAATLTSPIGGVIIDRTASNLFEWDHNSVEGGAQDARELRYRIGVGAWTTLTASTADEFLDIAGGTFTADDYEWQVRTSNTATGYGPFSASGFFTADDPPDDPVITSPADGATITTTTHNVTWTSTDQDAYEVRTIGDSAGSPDPSNIYSTTGTVVSAGTSQSVSFPVNGRVEHVQVRVRFNTLWSGWDDAEVTIDWEEPATPTVVVAVVNDSDGRPFAISVDPTQPSPTGAQPTVTSIDVYRRVVGDSSDGIRVAAGIDPDDLWTDYTVASRVDYEYRVKAFGDTGATTFSAWED